MGRGLSAALLSVFLSSAVLGCQPDEYAILISARSEAAVETLRLTVIPLDGDGRPFPSGEFPVQRSLEDIRDNEPIRVAVRLDGPREVMVHLQGRDPSGGRLVASRCYRVTGVIEDRVLLVSVNDSLDADGDGWLDDPSAACFEPGAGGPVRCAEAYRCASNEDRDCDDADGEVHPGAQELCNDGMDQDCDGEDSPCDDADGDTWRKCSPTDVGGRFGGTCDCNDDFATINPGVDEDGLGPDGEPLCGDGIDQDCDGRDLPCDRDGDSFREGADCNDSDPEIHPDAMERCTDPGGTPVDENCNGLIDELIDCAPGDLDKDGFIACGHPDAPARCDCNDCDSGIHPDAVDACEDGVDADCDTADPTCPVGDMDKDGVAGTASGGTDCDDTDPRVFPGAPDRCGDGVAQNCAADTSCDEDVDGDGYVEAGICADDPSITYWREETCNAIDDDCNMTTDEVLNPPDAIGMTMLPQGRDGCVGPNPTVPGCMADACVVDYTTNIFHCGECRKACNPGAQIIADRCTDGVCDCEAEPGTAACATGWSCCESGCKDVENDILHCGRCNMDCNEGRPGFHPRADSCVDGSCACGTSGACTDTPFTICCGGSCVDPMTDRNNCGACGNTCGPNSSCVGGRCVCDAAHLADCDGNIAGTGCETDTRTDLDHCGGCGVLCRRANATASCTGGTCMINTCNVDYDDCNGRDDDGCETSLTTLSDCGSCGTDCSLAHASETCSTGTCRVTTCDSGWGNCDGGHANGCETSLTTLTDCGSCGTTCSLPNATATCSTGSCRVESCDPGWGNCDGVHSNGCEQQLNTDTYCGSCTTSCSGGETCMGGTCCECAPGTMETGSCGMCGTRERTCTSSCSWGAWGSCTGEGVCSPGTTDSQSCGMCGTQTRTCDSMCAWGSWGTCTGEGVCTPGEVETEACGNCGTRERTCTSSCTWGSWSACMDEGVCSPGTTDSQSCGMCGTQTRTCDSMCAWGTWGTCTGEGVCMPGATESRTCCNGGTQMRTCDSTCGWGAWGSCSGTNCGDMETCNTSDGLCYCGTTAASNSSRVACHGGGNVCCPVSGTLQCSSPGSCD